MHHHPFRCSSSSTPPLNLFFYLLITIMITLFMGTATSQPIIHFCPNTSPYTPTYEADLNSLLSNLSSNGNRESGFYNFTAGDHDAVYGLFMCRGDVSAADCQTCVNQASSDILRLCPKRKTAIIWYDHCMLRFSDRCMFGSADQSAPENVFYREKKHSEPDLFMQLVGKTLELEQMSSGVKKGKKFGTQQAKFNQSDRIFSFVQCTPDISDMDCHACLTTAIQRLYTCCYSAMGARVLFPSCNVRYETYLFYNTETAAAASAPPPPAIPPTTTTTTTCVIREGITFTVVPAVIGVILLIAIFCFVRTRNVKKRNITTQITDADGFSAESRQYDFVTIQAITNDFSSNNKIGEGGYGYVYKGVLNGQEVAVKRLSRSSGQGAQEFKNEVEVVVKLQHRNLVRLLGFCSEGDEKILIYEFIPNKSLDYFLFDLNKQCLLEWSKRYKIIRGIARGLLYLHEDSRLRIIHRDLKTSNILLDANMDPKIADFGMARIFGVDQTQGSTNRIVGTYGYMSPEYARRGEFSVKSDVFSFGVMLLEIISGKKNLNFLQSNGSQDLLGYAWEQWRNGKALEILDPVLTESYEVNEVIQCIHIGLLCVQEAAIQRPTMVEVMLMLNSYSSNSWPSPREPAFYYSGSKGMLRELVLEQSITVNEASISELCPR